MEIPPISAYTDGEKNPDEQQYALKAARGDATADGRCAIAL